MTEALTSDFDEFISDENMRLAWKRMTHSMRREVKDWLGLQAYAPQIDAQIQILQESLMSGYKPSDAYSFFKTKQDRSLRMFSFLTMDDRFVYQTLCNVLIENSYGELMGLANDRKIYANIPTDPKDRSPYVFKRVFANRFSSSEGQYDSFRGQVLRSRREFVVKYDNPWLVRTDVRSYFPSLDHGRLCNLLRCRMWLADERTRQTLMDCLKKWEVERGKGIPIGYECSDHIGNVFLIPLDEALADFTVHRYVDDIYIYVENFERAKEAIHLVDKILENLSLQRNTVKTEFLNLHDLYEKDLKQRLTESLSQLATEKPTESSEQQRQRDLLGLLKAEFGEDLEKLQLRGQIENIGLVAFVLYRLRRANEKIRHLAYHILDHHPNYSFHAMTYLYEVYSHDPELEGKLVGMFEAEYEAEDVKANALKFLSLIDSGSASIGYVKDLLEYSNTVEWHLTYLAMRDIFDRNRSHEHSELLIRMVKHPNPILSAFAATKVFSFTESEARIDLVRTMLRSKSDYARKIGLYLAYRYQVDIDPSPVPCSLEGLMSSQWLGEKESFHKSISELFHIDLLRDFPIEKYFGKTKQVNQTLRDIRVNLRQGIDEFMQASKNLVNTFFEHMGHAFDASHDNDDEVFPDDNDLKSLLRDLEQNTDGRGKWNNGNQDYLLGKVREIMRRYLKEVQVSENMIVRDEVFICYARKNNTWKERVRTHLKPYVNYFDITVWSDNNIRKGRDWDQEIKAALQRAKVAILLETPEFLASNYIHNDELPEIMRAEQDEGLVIMRFPISTSAVGVTPLARFEAVWDSSIKLQNLIDDKKRGRVDEILADACKEVTCKVSERFRLLYCKDDE